jgi:hypothetical protein
MNPPASQRRSAGQVFEHVPKVASAPDSLETRRPINAFVVRREPKKHSTLKFAEGRVKGSY